MWPWSLLETEWLILSESICGMRNVPLRLTYLTTWPQFVVLYGEVMGKYRLAGGWALRVYSPIPRLLPALLCVWRLRYDFLASCFCHNACRLLSCLPVMTESIPLELKSKISSLFHKSLMVMLFHVQQQKIPVVTYSRQMVSFHCSQGGPMTSSLTECE